MVPLENSSMKRDAWAFFCDIWTNRGESYGFLSYFKIKKLKNTFKYLIFILIVAIVQGTLLIIKRGTT